MNWKIMSHPMNWLTIGLMLLFASIFAHLILTHLGVEPSTSDDSQ